MRRYFVSESREIIPFPDGLTENEAGRMTFLWNQQTLVLKTNVQQKLPTSTVVSTVLATLMSSLSISAVALTQVEKRKHMLRNLWAKAKGRVSRQSRSRKSLNQAATGRHSSFDLPADAGDVHNADGSSFASVSAADSNPALFFMEEDGGEGDVVISTKRLGGHVSAFGPSGVCRFGHHLDVSITSSSVALLGFTVTATREQVEIMISLHLLGSPKLQLQNKHDAAQCCSIS